MFGFAQWDSPLALALEALISLALVVALLLVAQRVNARAAAERERYLQTLRDASPSENLPSQDRPAGASGAGTEND